MSDPHPALQALKRRLEKALLTDIYGTGDVLQDFEQQVAQLLGFPEAVFAMSGTLVQPIALRLHCEKRNGNLIAFHPTCHLELHEQHGYKHVHNLEATLVGNRTNLFALSDLRQIDPLPQALLIELPQREIGGQLPDWDDLVAQTNWARENGIAVHLDGARLWESQPHYNRSYSEIAGLFDSAYVSFYKGLGGLSGAMLLGSEKLIEESRIWIRRCGGNLFTSTPYVLSAIDGLENNLPRIPSMVAAAQSLASSIASNPSVDVIPEVPVTNMFHVHFDGDRKLIEQQNDGKLFRQLQESERERQWKFEFSIRPAKKTPSASDFRQLVEDIICR